jgi:HK97 family phage major capsid protein
VSIAQLNAAADLRSLRHADVIGGLTITALLNAPVARRHDVPVWRSLSNLIGSEWATEMGLPSPTSWWGPRRCDVRALVGSRSMSVGSTPAAGDLAISSAVAAIAEAIRPRLVLERAGAIRQEVGGVVDATAPEWSGGSGAWVAEGVEVPGAAVTVSAGTATPKTAGAYIEVSRRLLKQAEAIEADLGAELRRLVAGTVEAGLIAGSGSEAEPLGLIETPGATAVAFTSATPTYAELVEMTAAYYDSDGDPDSAAWFVNPADFTDMLSVSEASGTGQYAGQIVAGNRYIIGIRAYLTNHVPAGKAILTDPRNLLITYWRAPLLITNPYALDTSGGQRLTVLNDVDITVRHRPQLIIGG